MPDLLILSQKGQLDVANLKKLVSAGYTPITTHCNPKDVVIYNPSNREKEFELLQRTISWNTTRGNTPDTLDWPLELDMLQEELDELRLAVLQNDEVGCFDALLDLKFVLTGTLGKMALTPPQIVDGYSAVLSANETKSSTKNADGKIAKPIDFQGPEPKLQAILDER